MTNFGQTASMEGYSDPFKYKLLKGEFTQYKFHAGTQRLFILPIPASTPETNPDIANNRLKVGEYGWLFEVRQHKSALGTYLCPKSINWNGGCPVCEAGEKLKTTSPEDAKQLFSRKRAFFNVIDLDHPELGIQLLETAGRSKRGDNFPDKLQDMQRDWNATKQAVKADAFFPDPDNGLVINVFGNPKTFGGHQYFEPVISEFTVPTDIDVQIIKSLADKAPALDQYVKYISYDEMNNIFFGDVQEPAKQEVNKAPVQNVNPVQNTVSQQPVQAQKPVVQQGVYNSPTMQQTPAQPAYKAPEPPKSNYGGIQNNMGTPTQGTNNPWEEEDDANEADVLF